MVTCLQLLPSAHPFYFLGVADFDSFNAADLIRRAAVPFFVRFTAVFFATFFAIF